MFVRGWVTFGWFFSHFYIGQVLEEGSGLQVTKLALGLALGLTALRGPILKLERPTLALVRLGQRICPFDWLAKLAKVGHLGQPIKAPVKQGFGDWLSRLAKRCAARISIY